MATLMDLSSLSDLRSRNINNTLKGGLQHVRWRTTPRQIYTIMAHANDIIESNHCPKVGRQIFEGKLLENLFGRRKQLLYMKKLLSWIEKARYMNWIFMYHWYENTKETGTFL
jgi:hypothetical protein